MGLDVVKNVLEDVGGNLYIHSEKGKGTKMCIRDRVDDRTFQVNEELRYRIRFEKRNLLEPRPSTERFDLILCRNVMIYFDRDARMRLVRRCV